MMIAVFGAMCAFVLARWQFPANLTIQHRMLASLAIMPRSFVYLVSQRHLQGSVSQGSSRKRPAPVSRCARGHLCARERHARPQVHA